MKLSTSDVEYVAKLARLEVSEAEKEKFTAQLNDILRYIDQLNGLDTAAVAPMSHVIDVTNVFREDAVAESLAPGAALTNAPDARGEFFRVPKVIE